jgi:hypothetical protein
MMGMDKMFFLSGYSFKKIATEKSLLIFMSFTLTLQNRSLQRPASPKICSRNGRTHDAFVFSKICIRVICKEPDSLKILDILPQKG